MFALGCSGAPAEPRVGAQPQSQTGPSRPAEAVSWRPDPDARISPPRLVALACDGESGLPRQAACGGLRQLTSPTGATQVATEWLPSRGSVEALSVPDRLGGDLLILQRQPFQTNLWRASDYTSPVRPVAAVSLDVDQVAMGFDRVYLLDRKANELVALDAATGQRLDRGTLPYSVAPRSLAFLNDRVAAIETEVRGVLVTKDAGKTWTPLDLDVTSPAIELDGDHFVISTPSGPQFLFADLSLAPGLDGPRARARLGELTGDAPVLSPPRSVGAAAPRRHGVLGAFPLRTALLYGFPDSGGGALVLAGGALARVRIADGAILRAKPDLVREPGPCPALRFGDSVAFVCPTYGGHGGHSGQGDGSAMSRASAADTVIYAYEPPFALRELLVLGGPRAVAGGAGGLVVRGGCGRAPIQGTFCAVPTGGAPWQYTVPSPLAGGRERAFLGADGRLVVVVPPAPVAGDAGGGAVARLEWAKGGKRVASVAVPIPDTEAGALLREGLWMDGWVEDGRAAAGWIAAGESFVGVRISPEGQLEPGIIQKRLSETLFDGPRALVVRQGAVAFESEDGGFGWQEVALPNAALEDTSSSQFPRGCSRIGCAIGRWLRMGWGGEGPPKLPTVAMPEAPRGERAHRNRGGRWSFNCDWVATPKKGRTVDKSGRSREGSWTAFFGKAPPQAPKQDFRYEYTEQHGYQAYAWGPTREHWDSQAKWLIRAFDWFDPGSSTWSTAVTPIPWADAATTASRFGVNAAVRWTVNTDPMRHTGLIVLGEFGNEQVFQFSEGSRIGELASARGVITHGVSGVVRVGDRWYAGVQQSHGVFLVYELTASDATLIAQLPLHGPRGRVRARLVRSVPDEDLGILVQALGVRSVNSRWAIYPLDRDERSVGEPLALDEQLLGRQPKVCGRDARGWLLATQPPLLPRVEVGKGRVWLNDVFLRGIFDGASLCVEALGAWGRVREPEGGPNAAAAHRASLPLVVADRLRETRATLRCWP